MVSRTLLLLLPAYASIVLMDSIVLVDPSLERLELSPSVHGVDGSFESRRERNGPNESCFLGGDHALIGAAFRVRVSVVRVQVNEIQHVLEPRRTLQI
jgi:hypothetical protein